MAKKKNKKCGWQHPTRLDAWCVRWKYHTGDHRCPGVGTWADVPEVPPLAPIIPPPKPPETIDHPAHYGGKDNPYETIKVIHAWGLGFDLGNAVKYISRAGKKGSAVEDLKKARFYLNEEIARLEAMNKLIMLALLPAAGFMYMLMRGR